MSRHRNVRAMNIDEEYEGYYDSAYGHSVEEEFCISPRTEAQFLYNRDAQKHSMSAFLGDSSDSQLDEHSGSEESPRVRCDSLSESPSLSNIDKAKLQSCVEAMQNVVGDTIVESILTKAAIDHGFDVEKALDAVLSGSAFETPKPQRTRKQGGTGKEFCIHRKCAAQNYNGWVLKNCFHYNNNVIQRNGCSKFPSIFRPWNLQSPKDSAFFDFCPFAESQWCEMYVQNGFASPLHTFYSLPGSSDSYSRNSVYKPWEDDCHLTAELKSEFGNQELVNDGFLLSKESTFVKAHHHTEKLLRFHPELFHQQAGLTAMEPLLFDDKKFSEILQVIQFTPCTVLPPLLCTSSDFLFCCRNCSSSFTVPIIRKPSDQKCDSSVISVEQFSIRSFLSLYRFIQYEMHPLLNSNHYVLCNIAFSQTDHKRQTMQCITRKNKDKCDPKNFFLESHVWFFCSLLFYMSKFKSIKSIAIDALQTAMFELWLNFEKCEKDSYCKHEQLSFNACMKRLRKDCPVLMAILDSLKSDFSEFKKEGKLMGYHSLHINKRKDRRQRQNRKKQRAVSCSLLNVSQEIFNNEPVQYKISNIIPKFSFFLSQKCAEDGTSIVGNCESFEIENFCRNGSFAINVVCSYDKHTPYDFGTTAMNISGTDVKKCSKIMKYKMIHPEFMHTLNLSIFSGISSIKVLLKNNNCFHQIVRGKSLHLFPVPSSVDERFSLVNNVPPPTSLPEILIVSQAVKQPECMFSTDVYLKSVCSAFPATGLTEFHADGPAGVHSLVQPHSNKFSEYCDDTNVYGNMSFSDVSPSLNAPGDLDTGVEVECNSDSETCDDLSLDDLFFDLPSSKKLDSTVLNSECYCEIENSDFSISRLLHTFSSDAKEISLYDQESLFVSPPLTAEPTHISKFDTKNSRDDLCDHSELAFSCVNLRNAELSNVFVKCLDDVEKEVQDTGLCNKSQIFSPNDQILLGEKSGVPLSDVRGDHNHICETSDVSALQYKISNCCPSNTDHGNISGLTKNCSEDLSLLDILCNQESKLFSAKPNALLSDRGIGQKCTVLHESASINEFLCDLPCKIISSVGNKIEASESSYVTEVHNSFVPQNSDASSIQLADLCPTIPLTHLCTGDKEVPKNSLSGMYKVFDPKEEITVKTMDNDFTEDSSDKENDVLSFSLSDIFFGKTGETVKKSHKAVHNISPLTQCNAKIPNLSVEHSFDVMGETQVTCLHSKSQSFDHPNGAGCQSEVPDILLSGVYENQDDSCRTLDALTLKNKISKYSAADTSHANISDCCTDMSENMPALSFSDFLNKESNNKEHAANTCVNDSSSDFSCIAIPSMCSTVNENTCFKERCNSFAPLADLTTIANGKISNADEQDSVPSLSLSDLYSKMQFSHSFPGDKTVSVNSLSDCFDGFQTKDDLTVNSVSNSFGDSGFQHLSLSDLYHSMKPKAQENSTAFKDTGAFPSTILSNLSPDLDSTVNHGYSLLDLYINSESDKVGCSEDSDCTTKQTPVGILDFELSCIDQIHLPKTDFEKECVKSDLGIPEVNKIDGDCKYDYCDITGVLKFPSADNCSSSTNCALERSQCVHSETLLEAEQLQLTTSASKLHQNLDVEEQTDLPYIDLSVAQKLSPDLHTLESSLSCSASAKRVIDHGSKIPTSAKELKSMSGIKTKNSLFAKVLSCKTKPPNSCAIPKPPQTLSEILEFIHYNKHFDFTTPSPDDEVKMKQSGALSSSGSASTIKAPTLETVEDEKEFVFERELSGRLIISNGEVKTPDDIEKSRIENSTKDKAAVPEDETGHQNQASEKRDVSPNDDRKSKNDETSTPQPAEHISKLKNEANVKEVIAAYQKERGGNKPLINLVVIGHVDAGKSTLMGHLLYRLGCVAKKIMHKYEQDSKKLGKSSFMYAWVLDETSEERNRGITMDVAQSRFETPHRSVTLLDAPGHKDFIPNMITGAAQADVAILVLDSTRGEFETGFEAGGQTREHTMLIRSLGVSQLAVVVNKLDNVNWDQGRYNEIVSKLSSFLKQAGFKEAEVQFVPCSGLTGENLIKPPETPELKKWYSGPCLVDVIDSFKPPERPVSKPFRFCISDVFKGMGSGFCVSGRIEAGYVQNGDKVLVMPAAEQATVKGITIDETSAQHSFAGDHATLQLSGVDMNNVTTGCVVCEVARPVKVSPRFQARLVIFNITVPITKGFPVILHYQSMSEQANVKKLISQLHRSTGQVVKKKPRCLLKNTSAVVEIEVIRPICLEVYKDFKELGRFMLRSGGSTIAAGLVTEIL